MDHASVEDQRPDPARTARAPAEHLDLGTALGILEAVSGETDLERLLVTALRLGVEHAGAERGLLLLARGDAFPIEARAEVSGDGVSVSRRQSAVSAAELPVSVLRHVLRTRETVLLHDASSEHPFSADEYVRQRRARSVLCMPLLRQSSLVGVIYLENNRTSGVFTPARTAVLTLLASAVATSLNNTRLYRDLQEREARIRRLVDSNVIGVVIWHADGRVLETNDAFLRIVGYSREELLSGRLSWTDFTPPEWHDGDARALEEVKATGTVQAHERECIRKDGTRVRVLAAGAVFDGTPDEGVAFVLDLTEPTWAERAQRATERESRLIIDTIPGMVGLLTATGAVEMVNRQLLDYFGQTLEELRSWGTNGTVHPEDLPHVADVFTRSIASGSPYNILQRFRRADGVYRWFENRGFPLRDEQERIVRWCVLLEDIEERKHAEDALRESERELRLIVDSIPGLVAAFTPAGELEFVNRQVLEYFGRTFEELRQWGTDDTLHPEEKSRVAELFARAMATGEPFEFESRARHVDGTYRWHQSRGFPLRGRDGRIVRWYNLIIDIDERKRAEEALAGSERKLKLTIDTIPALAWSTGPDGSADFFSQHYLDFVGLSAEQAGGWGWTTAVHPDDLNGLAATWQELMAAGRPGEAEARLRRHDGEYRWFLFRTNPLRDETGRIVKWYGVNTDIEDRKRAEAELRRSEAFLMEGQHLARIGNFSWRVATEEITWSEQIYRMYELEPGTRVTLDLIGTRVHPEDVPLLRDMVERAQRGVSEFEYEHRLSMPDHSIRHLHLVAHRSRDDQGRLEYVGAVQDVTQRRLSEEALSQARAELTHVARVTALSTLTASIAHEVNQPLSGIITNAGTCLRMLDADPPNVDGARETARRTLRDGRRAADVITRLRAMFSRKEFALESMDLSEAAREVLALSSSDLQRRRVIVLPELADDLRPVIGDRVQLQQVILNLLLNAAEAMSDVHGRPRELTIRTERSDGDGVRLTVRDTGVGVDPRSMDRLFDAFYTTKPGGMGIGLSVSRSIIERHHGRLWVEPGDGPGATFAFAIPCRPRDSQSIPRYDGRSLTRGASSSSDTRGEIRDRGGA